MGLSERKSEINRRRHRRKKLAKLKAKLEKAKPSERALIAERIRRLTPGAPVILKTLGLDEE